MLLLFSLLSSLTRAKEIATSLYALHVIIPYEFTLSACRDWLPTTAKIFVLQIFCTYRRGVILVFECSCFMIAVAESLGLYPPNSPHVS
ncbi:hypothetical protein PILCRDRAFT_293637 [Piloderma croceum F 1598]|uniref:Uncharacterized protein n=1 Tax=Piloderma croceum (strain F 1598) TaxID=765440 RepID=A0A0C3G571_PILCF|nr:hypothetical protein PILCRDRAFT_293637 [Piloderma croceum F 1598]